GKDPQRQLAQYLFDANRATQARAVLRRILNGSIKADGNVEVGRAKFCALASRWTFRQGTNPQASRTTRGLRPGRLSKCRLPAHLPVGSRSPGGDNKLHRGPHANASPVMETWLLACMLEFPGKPPVPWSNRARVLAKDRNSPNYVRVIAA